MSALPRPDPTPANRPAVVAMEAVKRTFAASLATADHNAAPYPHWMLHEVFSDEVLNALTALPFAVPDLEGVSGARELHNNTRQYFDSDNNARYPVCGAVADAFQSPQTAGLIRQVTGADIDGCYLRVEYAQDTNGFWLQPHTDLGVKKLTMLYYLADAPDQESLGTDIYSDRDTWAKRTPFIPNTAMVFVPSDHTWHGFEPRAILGVRKSVIINYVTDDWRAREQLAYGETPVRA